MKHPVMKMKKSMGMKGNSMKMGKGVGGPSDLAAALKGARPGKVSRSSSMKAKLFGKG